MKYQYKIEKIKRLYVHKGNTANFICEKWIIADENWGVIKVICIEEWGIWKMTEERVWRTGILKLIWENKKGESFLWPVGNK